MAKLNRRRIASRALENRQMFAADILVPLAEAGINSFNETIYGDLYDPRYDPARPEYDENLTTYSPNLSGEVGSILTIAIHEDNTTVSIRHQEAPTTVTPYSFTGNAGDRVLLYGSNIYGGYYINAGDVISSNGEISVTRQVDDTGFYPTYPADLEAGLVVADPRIYSGNNFSVPILSADLSASMSTELFTDAVGFISVYEAGTDIWIEGTAGVREYAPAAEPLAYGEQVYITDADLQALGYTQGWSSVDRIYSTTGAFTLSVAAGNDTRNTSYWVDVLPDANAGTDYLLPMPNNWSTTANVGDLRDVIYLVHNSGASDALISLSYRDSSGLEVNDDPSSLLAGDTRVFTDIRSAARLTSTSAVSVYAFSVGVDVEDSGWGAGFLPVSYLTGDVIVADPGALTLWVSPSENTSILIDGALTTLTIYEYNGEATTGRQLTGDALERVESDSTGEVWFRFEAEALSTYRIDKAVDSNLRISSDGDADISVVIAPSNSFANEATASISPSVPKLEIYRDLIEQTFDDGRVGIDGSGTVEIGVVRLLVQNNSDTTYVLGTPDTSFLKDTLQLPPAGLYSEDLNSAVQIRVLDNGTVLESATVSLSALRTGDGLDLAGLFTAAFDFAPGMQIEATYKIDITPTVTQALIDADYGLSGTTSLILQGESYQRTSPLFIEVDEAPLLNVVGSSIEYSNSSILTNGVRIYTRFFSGLENADDVRVVLDFDVDFQNLRTLGVAGDDSTVLKINGQSLFDAANTSTSYGSDGLLLAPFSLDSTYGSLVFNSALTDLETGQFVFDYVKTGTVVDGAGPGDLYDHSTVGSRITESFKLELTNNWHKYFTQNFEIRIQDLVPSGANSSATGGTISEKAFGVSTPTQNIITQSNVQTIEGDPRVVYVYSSSGRNGVDGTYYGYPGTGSVVVYGYYGKLTISVDGDYSYQVYTAAERSTNRGLEIGETATDTFRVRMGDDDWGGSNPSSYDDTSLSFTVTGEREISFSPSPGLALDVPQNGEISFETLTFRTLYGVRQLYIDLDGTADGLGNPALVYQFDAIDLQGLSSANPEETIITAYGTLTLHSYSEVLTVDADGNSVETGTLVFSILPTPGLVTANTTHDIGFFIQDENLETLGYTLNLNLIPAIEETGQTIWVDDQNDNVVGDYTVTENENSLQWNTDNSDWLGITLHVEPPSTWRSIAINGVFVVESGRFYDDSDPDNIFSTVGRRITGQYGDLIMRGGDKSRGEIYLSYESKGDATYDADLDSQDHSNGALLDQFNVVATDIVNVSAAGNIEVLLADTYPTTEWDYVGDTSNGVLTEDEVQIEFSGTVANGYNVLLNDTPSLDSPNEIIGVKSLDLSGGGLLEFASNPDVFISREDEGLGVNGLYGTLWMDRQGNFTYVLDNSRTATQALTEDRPGVEQFAYTLADKDAHPNNNPISRSAARLYIHINGAPDPEPVLGESSSNSDIPIPENGGITNQRLNIATTEALATLVVNGTEFTAAQLINASATAPLEVSGSCGTFLITGYNPGTGQLSYGFIPNAGSTSEGCLRESLSLSVTDTYGETASINIDFALAPPRVSDIPPITTTELLATDGSRTLVRQVYLQQLGLPTVQPTNIELTDPSSYFGGDIELGPLIDDRRLTPIEPYVPEEYALIVQRDIPPQLLTVESRVINYVVPSDTFLHTDQQARVSLAVTVVDGRAIPEWLEFDPNTATFSGIAPGDVAGEFLIKIVARDTDGRQAETVMRLIVEEPLDSASIGRARFSDQLAQRAGEERVDGG